MLSTFPLQVLVLQEMHRNSEIMSSVREATVCERDSIFSHISAI